MVNAASYAAGPLSAGEIVTVFGAHFGDNPRVLFDGIQARLIYASPQQLSVTVPYEAVRAAATSMVVEAEGRRSTPSVLALIHAHPGLFTADASGKGQGAILNQDASVNGPANPAERGSIIVLYGTGGGPLTNEELPRLALPVKVFIDGVESEVLYAGIAPGLASGAIQINVRVPESATRGEIVLRAGDVESQAVTVTLR